MKFWRKLNERSKGEQLFILIVLCVVVFAALCLSGCGRNNRQRCEGFQRGSYEDSDYTAHGISIPGCGGCLTPGKGCGSCLWPQSCKFVRGSTDSNDAKGRLVACDTQYYGSCGLVEKSVYIGFGRYSDDSESESGLFCGSNRNSRTCGGIDGCPGCSRTGKVWRNNLNTYESKADID